jgi:hypothetical protein
MRRRVSRFLLAVGLLAGCRPTPLPAPGPFIALSTTAVETREVQLADDFLTVRLHVPPTPERRKPAVISTLGDRSMLLRLGFLVVTYRINTPPQAPPEPPGAPARAGVGKWALASPSAGTLGRDYLHTIVRIADAIPAIVDHLTVVPEVDPGRIGMVGNSTQGFVALLAAARDRRLAAVVALTACGDFHRFLRYSSMGMEGRPLALAPDYERWVRAHEVVRSPQRLVHAAVLLVNRDGDPIIPRACADETARVLAPAYDRAGVAERFRYVVLHGEQHGLDERDVNEALIWLTRWLGRAGAAS